MRHRHLERLKNFKPPFLVSCFAALLFGAAAIVSISTEFGGMWPDALLYVIYVCAVVSLALATWSIVLFFKSGNPKKVFLTSLHKLSLTGRLYDDYAFRTVTFTYLSFGVNVIFAASKGVAGWFTSSYWLIAFAVYYVILCIAKLVLLSGSRRISVLADPNARMIREWKAYRLCGFLLMLLTIVLQGVVVLILRNGNGFSYYGVLIFVVALYDFVCLISSVVYMIKNRKKHSPIIVAINLISFATSLVAMLSLQTAMFAAFGNASEHEVQSTMNLLTGSGVCLVILILSISMVIHAYRKIKQLNALP